jgi:hypothetical protein
VRSDRWILSSLVWGALLLLPRGGILASESVVINEIFACPGPAEDRTFAFIELMSNASGPVDLAGWRLEGGIEFLFPEGAAIPPGGFVVVCRDRERFAVRFGGGMAGLLGDFAGNLDREGGRIVLADAHNRVIDAVSYHARAPWPEAPVAAGISLQRRCPDAPAYLGACWAGEAPTPGARNTGFACPPPAPSPPPVVINEVNYHPLLDRDEDEEFVEIFNRTTRTVDVSGWQLRGGALYTFPAGAFMAPGSFVVIGRNPAVCQNVLGADGDKVVGPFTGGLANNGERLALYDRDGTLLDAVFYGSDGEWPAASDGDGFSLERVSPETPGEDPANWATAWPAAMNDFVEVRGEGSNLIPGRRDLTLRLEGDGECLVDDVVLEDITDPANPAILMEDNFDAGTASWTITRGTIHGSSKAAPEAGVGGSGALRLVATEACNGLCVPTDMVRRLTPTLSAAASYRLRFKFKYVRGNVDAVAAIDDGLAASSAPHGVHTIGKQNSNFAAKPPPLLVGVGRYPREPRSSDQPFITATIRSSDPIESVILRASPTVGTAADYALLDDGEHGDGAAGDGIWGAELAALPHGTILLYTIAIRLADGREAVFPRPHDPTQTFGYYVNDNQPASNLPVYTIILPGLSSVTQASVNGYLTCETYRAGHFAYRGEVFPGVALRFRGFTGCYLPKRHVKVRFNHDRLFEGLRKINLNSLYTDKALVREHLAWEFLKDLGSTYCETDYVRLHINGEYFGLYLYLEHPDNRFLERNGLDPDGDVYKAEMGPYGQGACEWTPGLYRYQSLGLYATYWQEETNQDGDVRSVAEFIDGLHEANGDRAFLREKVDAESLIIYQIGQVALHNFDGPTKNHFLYHHPGTGLWHFLPWDQDLSFGKYFSLAAVGLGRPVGTLNDYMSCPQPGLAMSLWYGAEMTACGFPENWLLYYFFQAGDTYYQRAYELRFWDVIQEKYLLERFEPRIDALCERLAVEQADDLAKWGRYPSNIPAGQNPPPNDMLSNVEIMKEQITCHRNQLLNLIPSVVRKHARLRVTEIMAMPDPAEPGDTAEELEFVELVNPDESAIDVGGWYIDGIGYFFPAGTTVDAGAVVVVARNPTAFENAYHFRPHGPYGGELENAGGRLRVYDAGSPDSYPAVVDFVPFENGTPWPEWWRGHSIELREWQGSVDNDRGELWRRSEARGGTPGSLPVAGVPFIRGDINQDKDVQLSDAVFLLGYLFGRGATPACLDAADVNGDTVANVADAVYLLGYLFNQGAAPAPPFSACDYDTGQSLGCQAFTACGR